jgi:RNA polymerase sigma factor (sigma-70 family)
MTTTEITINKRVEKLLPRIRAAAGRIYSSQATPMVEQEDIAQEMVARIIERAHKIPGYDEQADAYLMIDATLSAGKHCVDREAHVYTRYVSPDIPVSMDVSDEDGFETYITEVAPDNCPSIDDQVELNLLVESISNRMNMLDPQSRKIITMSLAGMNGAEIGRALGITKQAVEQRRKSIKKKFADLL